MDWSQSKIEEVLKFHLLINANTDCFYNCYYKCANKRHMLDLFEKKNHEILFGRRGTGKTTILRALTYYTNYENTGPQKKRCFYVDMEDVIPNDCELSNNNSKVIIVETYRKLLSNIIDQFMDFWCDISDVRNYKGINYTKSEINYIAKKIDQLHTLVTYGTKKTDNLQEIEKINTKIESDKGYSISNELEISADPLKMSAASKFFAKFNRSKSKARIEEISLEKRNEYVLDVNRIKDTIEKIVMLLKLDCLIICIDEFTRVDKGVSETIQPYIAQLVKDTFFRINGVSMKITSLWNRTEMQIRQLGGARIGIELGEDIERGLDLDTMFFEDNHNRCFFKNMLVNTYTLFYNDNSLEPTEELKKYIVDKLFSSDEAFDLLVCGSQGIPRVFGNLIISAIDKRIAQEKPKIDPEIIYECVINNFTQMVRRKLPYTDSNIIEKFDEFIDNNKTRFILISTKDYDNNKQEINGLIDNNYMHQYPSEKIPRKIRNKYKVYLIHYGNYLEILDMKEWRKNIQSSPVISIYPQITQEMIDSPEIYQLHL